MSNCLILLLFWCVGEGSIPQPVSRGKDLTRFITWSSLKLIQHLITMNSCSFMIYIKCRRIQFQRLTITLFKIQYWFFIKELTYQCQFIRNFSETLLSCPLSSQPKWTISLRLFLPLLIWLIIWGIRNVSWN